MFGCPHTLFSVAVIEVVSAQLYHYVYGALTPHFQVICSVHQSFVQYWPSCVIPCPCWMGLRLASSSYCGYTGLLPAVSLSEKRPNHCLYVLLQDTVYFTSYCCQGLVWFINVFAKIQYTQFAIHIGWMQHIKSYVYTNAKNKNIKSHLISIMVQPAFRIPNNKANTGFI